MQRYHIFEIPKGGHIPRHAGEFHTPTNAKYCAEALISRTDLNIRRVEVRGKYGRVIHTVEKE